MPLIRVKPNTVAGKMQKEIEKNLEKIDRNILFRKIVILKV